MQPLIKITTEPIQIMRFTQNARLVTADSVDMERRKAIARQLTMHRTSGHGSSMESVAKINRAFSTRANTAPAAQQKQNDTFQQLASQQYQSMTNVVSQVSVPAYSPQNHSVSSADFSNAEAAVASASTSTAAAAAQATLSSASARSQNVSANASSSYAVQRGSFEMRVAKGELAYLPPMTMTIVTQRPSVHVEYLGGYNFFPPANSSANINLFT